MIVFDHIAITSGNLEETRKFYIDYLGLVKHPEWHGDAGGGRMFEFYCDGGTNVCLEVGYVPGVIKEVPASMSMPNHICFAVESVAEMVKKADELGYKHEPIDVNGNTMVYDPDGTVIELVNADA